MSHKVLDVKKPLISSYTSYGCLFSIMNNNLWPWIFNNFIQIRYAHNWGILTFDSHHILLKNCPAISFYDFPQDFVGLKWRKSLKEVIIEAIDREYYVYIYVDRYYISKTDHYKRSHCTHEVFIYGYDDKNETVFVGDNLREGQFSFDEVPFAEIEKGYWAITGEYSFWTDIRFLKVKKNVECKIDLQQISLYLQNYLDSVKTHDLLIEQEFDFGLKAMNRVFMEIENANMTGEGLDKRLFHLIYEHKLLMQMRLIYLMDNGYMSYDESLVQISVNLTQDYLILRNVVLKYNIKKDYKLLDIISNNLRDNLVQEKSFISMFINKINDEINRNS